MLLRKGRPKSVATWLLLIALLPACGSTGSRDVPVAPPSQIALERLVMRRHGHQVFRFGDKLLVFGGSARGPRWREANVECQEFDLQTGDSVRRGDLNRGKNFFVACPVDDALLAVSTDVERYDFASHVWVLLKCAGAEIPKSHFSAAAWQGRLYFLGGYPESAGSFRSLDPRSGAVRLEAPLPDSGPGDHFHIMETLSDGIHVVGGLEGQAADSRSEHWLFDSSGWHQLRNAPYPVERKFAAVAVVEDRLHIFGQGSGLRYDPADGSWQRVPGLPTMLAVPATFVWGERIYVVGGLPTGAAPATYVFDAGPGGAGEWETVRP